MLKTFDFYYVALLHFKIDLTDCSVFSHHQVALLPLSLNFEAINYSAFILKAVIDE